MSEIYYKGLQADMTSYRGMEGAQKGILSAELGIVYSLGPVFNGSSGYGIWALSSKQSFNNFVWSHHDANGLPYGPDHAQPVRFFAVTGDRRIPGVSPRGSWEQHLKNAAGFGINAVVLDNVQLLYEIPFEEMNITYANRVMRNYSEANKI